MAVSPPYLKQGDTIRIIATARCIEEGPVRYAKASLEQRGFKVELGDNLFQEDGYLAGTDEQRALDLNEAISSPHVKAILCARGGYGSVRILDKIDWSKLQNDPKWICGFSDITAIHNKLSQLGIQSIHSTMPINFEANSQEAIESLCNALMGDKNQYDWTSANNLNSSDFEGEVVGGNLSILSSLMGSGEQLNTAGKILFIEEVDEHLYHLDRMLMNMYRCGMFDNLKGIIVGGFTEILDSTKPFGRTLKEIIEEKLDGRLIPVCFDFPAGHFNDNRAISFGKRAVVKMKNAGCTFEQ